MKKFNDAFRGLYLAIRHNSALIQFLNAILAIVIGFMLKLDYYEWIIFIILIALVIMAEMFNTCIEKVCDLVSTEYNEKIRNIKDLSSGTVLFVSMMALIIALFILINKTGGLM